VTSDYGQITRDNIRWHGKEFDDISRLVTPQHYNERTHFIYQLLQNARRRLSAGPPPTRRSRFYIPGNAIAQKVFHG
jgi:hypothetical protein